MQASRMEYVRSGGTRALLFPAVVLCVGVLVIQDPDMLLSAKETITRLKTLMMRNPSVSVSEQRPEEIAMLIPSKIAPPPPTVMRATHQTAGSFSPAACQLSGQVNARTYLAVAMQLPVSLYRCLIIPDFTQLSLNAG